MQGLKQQVRDEVLYVTLARPEKRNAIDAGMIRDLTSIFRAADARDDVRAVLLAGEGPCFCAGADLEWMRASSGLSEAENLEEARAILGMYEALRACSWPVIARVHGRVRGGGVGLTAACDFALGEQSGDFSVSEARVGLVPGVISGYLVERIGESRYLEFALTARVFSAEEAKGCGLLSFTGDAAAVDTELGRLLGEIRRNSPAALRAVKAGVRELRAARPLPGEALARAIARIRVTEEAREGIDAFFAGRPARWER